MKGEAGLLTQDAETPQQSAAPRVEDICRIWRAAMAAPRLASSDEDLTAIGRLRYDTYIQRDGKGYDADHPGRVFFEAVDSCSVHVGSFLGAACQCALRITRASQAMEDERLRRILAATGLIQESLDEVVVCSRLVTLADMRARLRIVELFRVACRVVVADGLARVAACTRPDLLPLFEKFGFRRSGQAYAEPDAGLLQPMTMDLRDVGHLEVVRSPLSSVMRQMKELP